MVAAYGGLAAALGAALAAVLTSCGQVTPITGSRTAAAPTSVTGLRPTRTPLANPPATAMPPTAQPTPAPAPSSQTVPSAAWSRHFAADDEPIPRPAWVAVPVLTVWIQPGFARPVDAPVIQGDPNNGSRPNVAGWIASMTYSQKVDLGQRMATQALLDDPLTVLEVQGEWAHVLVDQQKGSVYTEGIEGWVPRSQITFAPLEETGVTATVTVPFAPAGDLRLSYGTRLPVVASSAADFEVATPVGLLEIPKVDVSIDPLRRAGAAVVRQAQQFQGLPYLWAGTSAYGFDCSGLTYAVYRQFGVTLARDAADQAMQGTAVSKDDLRPGDLVFFASGGQVHHVGFYAGSGMMLDAPETGGRVELVPMWTSYLAGQYSGARRYLG